MKQVIEAVAPDAKRPDRASVGPEAKRKPDIEAKCSQSSGLQTNAEALETTRANLRIRLAKMLFAELPQLFALETWQSYWQAFSPLRGLSDCERLLPSTHAFLLSSP